MKKSINKITKISNITTALFMGILFIMTNPIQTHAQVSDQSSGMYYMIKDNGRYNIERVNPSLQIFYNRQAWAGEIKYNGSIYNFSNLSKISESKLPDGSIEQERRLATDVNVILRLVPVNMGNYVKVEYELVNKTTSNLNMDMRQYWDTAIAGNDRSPFRVTKNGFICYSGDSQVTVYVKDTFNVVNPTSWFLGRYGNGSNWGADKGYTYKEGDVISPGDSATAFWWEDMTIPANSSKKVSVMIGAGPVNNNPEISISEPTNGGVYYQGQALRISGTTKDIDINDQLTIKWSLDNGAENVLSTLQANGTNQPFSLNYTLPQNLSEGSHTLTLWTMDSKGGVSTVKNINFIIKNFRPPTDLKVTNRTSSTLDLSFSTVGNDPFTTVYILENMTTGTTTNLGTSNTANINNLKPNTQYKFRVRAMNTKGEYTNYSKEISAYTLPNLPTKISCVLNGASSISLNWNTNNNPSGTRYKYEIVSKATGKILKSGLTTGNAITITDIVQNDATIIYIKALNEENLETDRVYMGDIYADTLSPVLKLTLANSNYTQDSVTIHAVATDNLQVKYIKLPNGSIVNTSSTDYTVSENGVYYFEAVDTFGNSTVNYIVVNTIDRTPPTVKIENNQNWTNQNVNVTITATDN